MELVKKKSGNTCFHSGVCVTAISTFYEVPGGLAQTLSKLGQISAIHSIPVFHAGNQEQMVLSLLFESGY